MDIKLRHHCKKRPN